MTFEDVLKQARGQIGPYCKACAVCNGKACKNQMPGPGAKGVGDTAIRNYETWQEIRVNMDTIVPCREIDTSLELFGRTFRLPIFAGPVGAVKMHYGEKYTDMEYNAILVPACAEAGIAAFTGDGVVPGQMEAATQAIAAASGVGIPTVKPWNMDTIAQKMALVRSCEPFAVAMDIDAAGLPFLKNQTPPAGSKSVEELRQIAELAGAPFVVKGVLTVKGALKALDAGASGIVVSNHGGRVLDQCPATAEVLAEIVDAVGGRMKIFVDGGLRHGVDIFKALALGADAVIVCRPFVSAVYGGGAQGVQALVHKLGTELVDTMEMCGAASLKEITRDMVRI